MLTMRELRGGDTFTLLGIIGKLDIKDEVVRLYEKQQAKPILTDFKKKELTAAQKAQQEKDLELRGVGLIADLTQTILANLNNAKKEINTLLADLTGTSVSTIEQLGFAEYTALILAFFKKPELKDFLTSISSLLK